MPNRPPPRPPSDAQGTFHPMNEDLPRKPSYPAPAPPGTITRERSATGMLTLLLLLVKSRT